jgi:hypothetical protein
MIFGKVIKLQIEKLEVRYMSGQWKMNDWTLWKVQPPLKQKKEMTTP